LYDEVIDMIIFPCVNRYFYRPVLFSLVFISYGPFLVALPVKLETCTYRAW